MKPRRIAYHAESNRDAWEIGEDVYIAPAGSELDTYRLPMGRRWESSMSHFHTYFSAAFIPAGWRWLTVAESMKKGA